jgi:hypothetical protein
MAAAPAVRAVAPPVPAAPSPLRRSAGQPLPAPTRRRLEASFGMPLTAVRVHAGAADRQRVAAAGARALAQGSDVFLGPGERADDLALMGHELAHVVQQRGAAAAPQSLGLAPQGDALEAEADRAGAAVAAGRPVAISGRADGRPRGSWLGRAARAVGSAVSGAVAAVAGAVADIAGAAMGFIRDRARAIPGYDLLGFALGRDPITGSAIDRTPAALLRGLIGLWPGGSLLRDALDRHGLIDRVGAWLGRQLSTLASVAGAVLGGLQRFVRSLGPGDILDPGGVWARARALVADPVRRVWDFAVGLAADVLGFIRDAVLVPLSRLAAGTRGYPLLRAVLGRDPLTGEAVARTPEAVIGGLMTLIGQQERWQQLVESRAVPRAWAWVRSQFAVLGGFVAEIPGLLRRAWQSLSVRDLLNLPGAIGRMASMFGSFVGRFVRWAGEAVLQLVQAMFEVLAPGAMPVLQRARSVLGVIFRNPVRFVGNLVRAGIAGFRQFLANVRAHLVNGLVGWLTGALGGAGLTLPTTWDLRGVLSLVLQVLGLTWANVRARLVRATSETVVAALETGFELVVTLVREGPAAAWRQLMEHLGNLRDMVMGQVREWVINTVVGQAVARIASMLNPAGAIIQAIIAIYNTVMFVRERLQQIVQVAEAFINGIAAIAAGNIAAAANRVEQTMGRLVPVVISFLARLLGLGGIGDTIRNILARVRAPVDRAINRVVGWIVTQARRLGRAVAGGGSGDERLGHAVNDGRAAVDRLSGSVLGRAVIAPVLAAIRLRYRIRRLDVEDQAGQWVVVGENSPPRYSRTGKRSGGAAADLDGRDRAHAIPFGWVKPAVSQYPRIRLRDPAEVRRAHAAGRRPVLSSIDWVTVGPAQRMALHTGMTIGVRDAVSIGLSVGAVFQARAPVTGNGVKDEMNRVLGTHYGYDRAHGSTAPHDTDHVWEKQLGGQDAEANLWPLNAGTNRSSGGTVRGEIERVRRELGIPASVRGLAGRWLRLRAA